MLSPRPAEQSDGCPHCCFFADRLSPGKQNPSRLPTRATDHSLATFAPSSQCDHIPFSHPCSPGGFQPAGLRSESQRMHKRATCAETDGYTAPNSLNFTTHCDHNIVRAVYGPGEPTQDSFTNCMNDCSVRSGPCYGIAYTKRNSTCWLLTSEDDSTEDNLIDDTTTDVALAPASQYEAYDSACPYANQSVRTTEVGLSFTIQCSTDMAPFGHYCPWSLVQSPWCKMHTATIDECIELCAQARPLCRAVSWSPDMGDGFGNCYLKDTVGTLVTGNHPTHLIHSALAEIPEADRSCPQDYYTSTADESSRQQFSVDCFQTRSGTTNITAHHQTDANQCMDDCALDPECEGMVFDTTMASGYENCQLLSDIGSEVANPNITFAQVIDIESNEPESSSSSSKAWIAGPVVGGVVAVVVVIVGIWFWRRRRNRRAQAPPGPSVATTSPPSTIGSIWRKPPVSPVAINTTRPVEVEAVAPQYELEAPDSRPVPRLSELR
ncbi:hypothetical protein BDV06DRAFT_184516 [Aspergillus oleicola]